MFENLDWDKLKVFSVVAELGSMNAAASRLKETAPTVSRKIDELERTLNARLLYRSPRGVSLTEAGEAVPVVGAPVALVVLEVVPGEPDRHSPHHPSA